MKWGRAEFVEAYEAGASIAEIAMFAGVASSTVNRHLKLAGVTLRPRGVTYTSRMEAESHQGEGHRLNAYGQCVPCKTKAAREKYQNDPEYRERKKAASRQWRNRQKEQG